jgi:hypothetical protein
MAATKRRLVLCLRNKGYEVSLERRKIYQVLPDRDAATHGQLRVIDESGEDYLYPAAFFAPFPCLRHFADECSPPSNKRVKLAARSLRGRIAFVRPSSSVERLIFRAPGRVGRRSLGAVR